MKTRKGIIHQIQNKEYSPSEQDVIDIIGEVFKLYTPPTKEKPLHCFWGKYSFKNDGENIYYQTHEDPGWKQISREEFKKMVMGN